MGHSIHCIGTTIDAGTGTVNGSDREFDQAFERLENEVPRSLSRTIRWLRDPGVRLIRIPLGILFIIGGLLWFLPIVGIEMLPIGLMLIAQDIPVLRRPVGRLVLWLEHKWVALRRQWKHQ